jgi:hypothetical protein
LWLQFRNSYWYCSKCSRCGRNCWKLERSLKPLYRGLQLQPRIVF